MEDFQQVAPNCVDRVEDDAENWGREVVSKKEVRNVKKRLRYWK